MKTITEFAGTTLKNALKTKQELLASGKTPEELPAAMGEALKLEGDKLTVLLNAVEVIEKKTDDLKRVVVWSLQEGEKAPRGTEQKGEHYFAIEFFPPLPGQRKPGKKHAQGEKRGERRGGKRRGRGPRREKGEGAQTQRAGAAGGPENQNSESGEGGEQRKRRRRWKPRGPRKEGQGAPAQATADANAKPLPLIQPKQASVPAAPAAAPASSESSEQK